MIIERLQGNNEQINDPNVTISEEMLERITGSFARINVPAYTTPALQNSENAGYDTPEPNINNYPSRSI